MRSAITSCLAFTLLLLSGTRSAAQSAPNGVVVSFDTRIDVTSGEPIVIQLAIHNRSMDQIEVDLGHDRKGSVRVVLTRPDGLVIEPPGPVRPAEGGISRTPRVVIPAGDRYSHQYILDEWVKLERPGTYFAEVSLDSPFRTSDGHVVSSPTTSRTLVVNVGARDVVRLRQACERLAQAAIGSTTAQAQISAAYALSYFVDPVAVPCMRTVIRATNRDDALIAAGLVRIGTEQARSVLEEMAISSDTDRFETASGAMRRFQLRQ